LWILGFGFGLDFELKEVLDSGVEILSFWIEGLGLSAIHNPRSEII
jgi:hypothetical protein